MTVNMVKTGPNVMMLENINNGTLYNIDFDKMINMDLLKVLKKSEGFFLLCSFVLH
jgi:hypothetical protein